MESGQCFTVLSFFQASDDLREKVEELEREKLALEQDVQERDKRIGEYEKVKAEANEALERKSEECDKLSSVISEMKHLKAELEECADRFSQVQAERDSLEGNVKQLQHSLHSAMHDLYNAKEETSQLQLQLRDGQLETSRLQSQVGEMERQHVEGFVSQIVGQVFDEVVKAEAEAQTESVQMQTECIYFEAGEIMKRQSENAETETVRFENEACEDGRREEVDALVFKVDDLNRYIGVLKEEKDHWEEQHNKLQDIVENLTIDVESRDELVELLRCEMEEKTESSNEQLVKLRSELENVRKEKENASVGSQFEEQRQLMGQLENRLDEKIIENLSLTEKVERLDKRLAESEQFDVSMQTEFRSDVVETEVQTDQVQNHDQNIRDIVKINAECNTSFNVSQTANNCKSETESEKCPKCIESLKDGKEEFDKQMQNLLLSHSKEKLELEGVMSNVEQRAKTAEAEIETMKLQFEANLTEKERKLDEMILVKDGQIEELKKQVIHLKDELASAVTSQNEAVEKVELLKEQLKNAQSSVEMAKQHRCELEAELVSLKTEKSEVDQMVTFFEQRARQFETDLEEALANLEKVEKERVLEGEEKKKEMEQLILRKNSEIESVRQQLVESEDEMKTTKSFQLAAFDELGQTNDQLECVWKKLEQSEQETKTLRAELEEVKLEKESLNEHIQKLKQSHAVKLANLNEKIALKTKQLGMLVE